MRKTKGSLKRTRRNFYIDKKFQTKFIAEFWLILAIGSLMAGGMVYWMAQNSTTVAIINGRVAVHTTAEYLLPLLVQTIAIELLVVSLATIWVTLLISHQIAGPLYRLKVSLGKMGEGDLSPMHLRQTDQLKEVAISYNESAMRLKDKLRGMKNASSLEEVKQILSTFKGL